METLLHTSIISFRNFSKGPGKQEDDDWIERQKATLLNDGAKQHVDFDEFKHWAEENLNIQSLLNTDDNGVSPMTQKKRAYESLLNTQKQLGSVFFALSYGWWESWL